MRKILLGIFVCFLLFSSIVFGASWWDDDYQYRRVVTIDNSGNPNTLTNYQIGISVSYDSDMQADFDDIRFVDSDDATELNYWLQESVGSSWAYFWVKVPSIGASSTKDIYMYYGNPAANSNSNIQGTMIVGDDFDDDSFNNTKWSTDANSGTSVESSGMLNVTCGFGVNSKRRHYVLEKNITDGIIEGKMQIDDGTNTNYHQYHLMGLSNDLVWWNDDLASVNLNEDAWVGSPFVRYNTRNDGSYTGTIGDNPQDFQEKTWMRFKIIKSNSFVSHYKNDTLMYNHTSNVPDEPLFVLLSTETGQLGDTSSDFWTAYDWVFVREYTPIEPTYSVGPEEEQTNDSDGDGVDDSEDRCPDTEGEQIVYGCSCEQILELKPGKNKGEYRNGCTEGTINVFTKQIGWARGLFD